MNNGIIDQKIAAMALDRLKVDHLGLDHVDHQYCSVGVSCEKNWNYRSDFGNCNIQTADSDMV